MEAIVLKGKSKENLKLIIELAKKLGVEVSILSEKASEEIALASAINEGKTGKFVDPSSFMNSLNNDFSD